MCIHTHHTHMHPYTRNAHTHRHTHKYKHICSAYMHAHICTRTHTHHVAGHTGLLLFLQEQTKGHHLQEISRFLLEQLPPALPAGVCPICLTHLGTTNSFCLGCLTNFIHPSGFLLREVFPDCFPLLPLPFAACILQPWTEKGFMASPVRLSAP